MRVASRCALLLLGTSCAPDPCPPGSTRWADDLCHLVPEVPDPAAPPAPDSAPPRDTGSPLDSGEAAADCAPLPASLVHGDPITPVASVETDVFMEYLDVAHLGDGRALLGANNGWSVLDLSTHTFSHVEHVGARSVYRLAADLPAGLAYGGTQSRALYVWDLADDPPVLIGEHRPWVGWHGDVAAAGGRVLVAAGDEGAFLLDGRSGSLLSTLAEPTATAVALTDTRAWVAGQDTLALYDLTDPTRPYRTATLALPTRAVDADAHDGRLVLALGGHGVMVVDDLGDTLAVAAHLSTDGPAYGVALDGDRFWAATWGQVSLGATVDGVPQWLGDEPAGSIALGVDAADGTAVVADWLLGSVLQSDRTRSSGELRLPDQLHVSSAHPAVFSLENGGLEALEVRLEPTAGLTVEPEVVELCPGESRVVSLDAGAADPGVAHVAVRSGDVDEPEISLAVAVGTGGVGSVHREVTLPAVVAGRSETEVWSLADHAGELVYIAWFAPS